MTTITPSNSSNNNTNDHDDDNNDGGDGGDGGDDDGDNDDSAGHVPNPNLIIQIITATILFMIIGRNTAA